MRFLGKGDRGTEHSGRQHDPRLDQVPARPEAEAALDGPKPPEKQTLPPSAFPSPTAHLSHLDVLSKRSVLIGLAQEKYNVNHICNFLFSSAHI